MSFRQYLDTLFNSARSARVTRQPKRGKPRRFFELEMLEDRRMLSFISVTVTFVNRSNATLNFLGGHADHGIFTDPHPPDTISPGASATWRTESNGVATGTEATATYQIGNDPTLTTTLHWDDPFIGDNSFDETAPAGYVASADGPEDGNNISATFSITVNLAGRGFPLNSTSWTALAPGAIFTTPTPIDSNGANPSAVSGRVTGLAVDPRNDTIYAATAGGGVWKNVSNSAGNIPDSPAGNSSGDWVPLTDYVTDPAGNPVPMFMGAIAVASSNPSVIYAGTGEANNSGDSYWGEGILVSQDGGTTWTLTGQVSFLRTAISQIVVDPQDPNTAWVAVSNAAQNGNPSAATGIYKTTNGLASLNGGVTVWTNTITAAPNATNPTTIKDITDPWSALVIDPTTTTTGGGQATLYAAIGNRSGSASNGLYRSTDSGGTWNLVNSTNITTNITAVTNAVNPTITTNAAHGLAVGQTVNISGVVGAIGVNGAQTVASVPSATTFTITLAAPPGAYTSGGQAANQSGRIALALSHPVGAANATIYASVANSSGSLQTFAVSTDGGATWPQRTNTPNYLNTLAWYANVVLADPITPTTVYAVGAGGSGGTMLESTDAGVTWTSIETDSNGVTPHVDHHALAIDGTGRLLDGNDGGVWRLNTNLPSTSWENLNGWESLNAPGLSINQITGIALSPAGSQMILTGSQDNGTNIFKGGQSGTFASAWTNVVGNDGGFVRIDPSDTNPANPITGFTSFQFPLPKTGTLTTFQRFDDLANSTAATNISSGINRADTADFYPPYVIDPNNSQRLVLGTNKLYATTDQGVTAWTPFANQPVFPTATFVIDSIAIAPSDPTSNTIYVGASDSNSRGSFALFVTTDGGTTWNNRTPAISLAAPSPSTYGVLQRVAVSPTSSTTAYVAVSAFTTGNAGQVWQTTDGGVNWTDITGTGLPNVPIESIAIVPAVNTLIVGTDTGIYGTAAVSGATTPWYRVGTGLPNVQVTDLQTGTYSDTGSIVAAGTHGRGVWEIQVTKVSVSGGVLILSGSVLGGGFSVQAKPGDPSTLQVLRGSTLVNEVPANTVNQIQVNGVGGSNSLTLDFSNGNFIPSGGVIYDGGTGNNGTLILKGQLPSGPFATEINTPTGPHSGTISLDGSQIQYTNLKPIIDTVAATSFTINGTVGGEQINIVDDPNGTENGFQATEVNSPAFEKIDFANKTFVTLNGLDGADTIKIDNPNRAAGLSILNIATGPTAGSTINVRATHAAVTANILGNASLTVNVGSLVPASGGVLDPVKGHLILGDTAGAATVNVDDTGSISNRTGSLTASTLTGLGMATGITYSGVQTLNISLGSGHDTLNIQSTSAATTVDGYGGNDGFNVGSVAPATGGILSGIQAALTLNGNGGVNTVTVDDSGDLIARSGTLTATQLTGLGLGAAITYSGVAILQVNLGTKDDTFNVKSTSAATTINANAGNDAFTVGSLAPATGGILGGIQTALTLNGNGGVNTVLFDDSGDLIARTGILTNTQLIGLDMGATITYGGMAMLQVNLGTKNDLLTITADAGIDTIHGDGGDDLIYGGAGKDIIYGDGGNDVIYGGDGNDIIQGNDGIDLIFGDGGNDTIDGNLDNDTIQGGAGIDLIHGNEGDDYLEGNDGSDQIYGDAGRDVLYGNQGSDTISGGDDEDVAYGGTGDDTISGDGGADRLYGEDGIDNLSGGVGDDALYGGAGNDTLHGDAGSDLVDGGTGGDIIHGDADNDTLFGGGGVGDQLFGEAGNDRIYGSDDGGEDPNFNDAIYFGDVIDGGIGDDLIWGLGGADVIHGGDGNDTIDGGVQGDQIFGEVGSDTIYAGLGADQLSGGDGQDYLYGQQGNDTLTGDADADRLDGGTGTDSLSGGDGNDELLGGGGVGDTLHGDAGDDLLRGSDDGADQLFGDVGNDRLLGNGGNDALAGGIGDDILDGGAGDDTLSGDTGSDVLIGGAGNDLLYGQNSIASGEDNKVDYLYGDFGTNGNEAGSGRDQLYGQGGNDVLFGEGDDDFIDAPVIVGPDLVDYGSGEGANPADFVPPAVTPNPPLSSVDLDRAAATLASGIDDRGRWTELAGSATGLGVSGDAGLSVEPSLAAGGGQQYVAWADSRGGNFEIYVARHTAGAWQELSGSAHNGGVSQTLASSRRPSLAIDASGQLLVAWTESSGAGTDIFVAKYDPAAGGAGAWVALAGSLAAGGISGTGAADQATIVNTPTGTVVTWLDASSGTPQVFAKQLVAGVWQAVGAGGASGLGISGGGSGVTDLSIATDGTKIAVTWSQLVAGSREIYLRELSGGAWNELAGSASAGGVSQSSGDSVSPTVAYLAGSLFLSWQDQTLGRSNVYAATYNGAAWQSAGVGANSGGGLTGTAGESVQPRLSSGGGQLYLSWIEDRSLTPLSATADPVPDLNVLYVRHWNGAAFVDELPGDGSFGGVSPSAGVVQQQSLWVDDTGHPMVAWQDTTTSSPEIYLRGNFWTVGTVYYVNDSSTAGDVFSSAAGGAGNTGLSPSSPKASVQQVLDGFDLNPGDVILVDAGSYSGGFSVAAQDAGALILGAGDRQATIQGLANVDASDGTLDRLNLAGGVASGADHLTLHNNRIAGAGLTLSGGTGAQVAENLLAATTTNILLSGAVQQATIEDDLVSGGSVGVNLSAAGVAGLELRDNVLVVSGTGIALSAAAAGHIARNDVTAGGTGLNVATAFSGTIESNAFHGGTTGVNYGAAAALSANRIYGNATGVVSTVAGIINGLGFVGVTLPNDISGNTTGVQLTGQMQNQHVFANNTGVAGSGILGGGDLAYANLIEANTTGVSFTGPIQFNRIAGNQIGVQANSNQLIDHNLIDRNTLQGVHVGGKSNVQIISNTFYSPTGDQVRIDGGASNVDVHDNILWSEGGYDLYVADDSTSGFFSDFNDLHASGVGKLVYWTRDFTDILDWQEDVAQYDLHSLGTTRVNPLGSTPQFFGRDFDDYRVFDQGARLRRTSPTIDAGDPRTDLGLPSFYSNLLTNAGFESGITGWTASPSGGVRGVNPAPFAGASYFDPGANAVTTLEQLIDVSAQGAAIDTQNLVAVYGGRVRSASEQPVDRGQITLTFLNGVGGTIKQTTVQATNVLDRWELIGERLTIPALTRQIRYQFSATRQSGVTNDSYLDGAFLYVQDNTVVPNLGAYGNTSAELTQNVAQHLVLRSPDLYKDWLRDQPLDIRWDSFGNTAGAPIKIDLYQDTAQGPQFVLTIAAAAPDTGKFQWIAGNSGVGYGTYGLRVQLTLVGNQSVLDRSSEAFTVPENTVSFFVNEASTPEDEYTSAAGDNRNTGKLADRPKPYPNNVLRIYPLGPAQTLYVDTGQYPLLYPLVVSNVVGLGDDEGFTFTGPTAASRTALLRHANPYTVAPIVELVDADFMTLAHLSMSGGQYGLYARNSSTNLSVSYLSTNASGLDGVRIEGASDTTLLDRITSTYSGRYGAYIDSPLGALRNSLISNSGDTGLYLNNPGAAAVEANEVAASGRYGIYVSNNAGTAVIGNANLALAAGNKVHDSAWDGIYAYGGITVAGNTVYNQLNLNRAGINVQNTASATRNVVHDSYFGIYGSSTGDLTENRVYHNTSIGIWDDQANNVSRNVVYSNPIGIFANYYARGTLANNLVYANTNQGILIRSATGGTTDLVNNTVYQPLGDAIRIENAASAIHLRNNVLWAQTGYDLSVANDSQIGFASDYNLFFTSGAGQVAFWQGAARANLLAWQNGAFTDQNSIAQDPRFVDADGADNQLGYVSAANDGRDDDFHEQSVYGSFHGGNLAPVVNAVTGLPIFAALATTADAAQSPAIDRGDASDSASAEPAPNGKFVNLGAYGGTAQASLSPAQYVLITRPDGGEVWPAAQPFVIRWRTEDLDPINPIGLATVDLYKGGALAQTLAANIPNTGQFNWAIPLGITPGADYQVRVTRGVDSDQSNGNFTITAPVHLYYVNDGVTNASDWTTAAGNDAFDGLSPGAPKTSIQAVLQAYALGPGDVIRVDAGTYNLSANTIITAADAGVKIEGYHDPAYPASHAVLNRGNTAGGSYVFDLQNADNTTLDNLWITGAYDGVYTANGADSDNVTLSNNTIYGNYDAGVVWQTGSNNVTITGNAVYGVPGGTSLDDQNYGLYLTGSAPTVTLNAIYNSAVYAVYDTAPRGIISANQIYNNARGLVISCPTNLASDQVLVEGNTVFANATFGISASQSVLLRNNVVYDHSSGSYFAVYVYYGEATGNLVFDNYEGLAATGGAYVHDNRSFHNTNRGLYVDQTAQITGNRSYGNATGVELNYYFTGTLQGNLIYANSQFGVLDKTGNGSGHSIVNNTIYQVDGPAIRLQNGAANATIKNNVVWAEGIAAYAISVAPDSEVGFGSDYNVFYLTAGAKLGSWENRDFVDRTDWFYELGFDAHSLTDNPLLAMPFGPDGVLGYNAAAAGSAQIIDDGGPGYATTGTWSTVATGGYQGDRQTTTAATGTATASWTFTGLVPGATYQVAITYPANPTYYSASPFSVYDGLTSLLSAFVDETVAPSSFSDAGVNWKTLGTFRLSGDALKVLVSSVSFTTIAADAVRIQQIDGDHGADDDFHLSVGSPAIDAGDLNSYYFSEQSPNGDRIDAGAYGNTPQAFLSPAQTVQVLSPNGLDKFIQGQTVPINWRSSGLTTQRPVLLLNAGGPRNDNWNAEAFRTSGTSFTYNNSITIDTSAVANPAPQQVYKSESYATYGIGNALSYRLPVPDGNYTIRLHFVDQDYSTANQRKFDVKLQGVVRQAAFDIVAVTGAKNKATTLSFAVTASGGGGIALDLVNVTNVEAIVNAIELTAANPLGVANPTVDLQLSSDGGANWSLLAAGLAMDSFGRGAYNWSIPAAQPTGNDYRIRAVANGPVGVSDASDRSFLIANGGHDYYVNDNSTVGDELPSAVGGNANSGKTPTEPMLSLFALLSAYTLGPGDVVHVNTGNYLLVNNLTITGADSGVTIQGPVSGQATLNRNNVNAGSYAVELQNADNVTLDRLRITGADYGIYASAASDSDHLTISHSAIFGTREIGIYLESSNDYFTLSDSALYGLPGGNTSDDQSFGVYVRGANTTLTGNEVFDHGSYGIYQSGVAATIANNHVFSNNRGLTVSSGGSGALRTVVSLNRIHDNAITGLDVSGSALVANNVVYNQNKTNAIGINAYQVEVANNVVYDNFNGIYVTAASVHDNRVFANRNLGMLIGSDTVAASNRIYNNATGVLLSYGFVGTISNNLIYANTNYGILNQAGYGNGLSIVNNTIYQPTGIAVRVEQNTRSMSLRNNILWTDSGTVLSVGNDSQLFMASDYNLFTAGPTGKLGVWQGQNFTSLAEWYWQTGQDQHSRNGDPQFINPAGLDGALGYSSAPVGAATILDDGAAEFSTVGSWTTSVGGYQADFRKLTTAGLGQNSATWLFTGLTPGATYQLAVTYPADAVANISSNVPFDVLDGSTLLARGRVNEQAAPADFSDAGVFWTILGNFRPTGTQLSVRVSDATSGVVLADAARLQRIAGDQGADDNFQVATTSPSIDAGDPLSLYFSEPLPNGGRVNQGYTGGTSLAQVSPLQVLQVLSPNGNEKLEQGQIAPIAWQSNGLLSTQTVALFNAGGPRIGYWGPDSFRTSGTTNDYSYNNITIDTSAVVNPAPAQVYKTESYATFGIGSAISYRLPVPDGDYTIRLHFVDQDYSTANQRKFDVKLQGVVRQSAFDIVAVTGAKNKATTLTFAVSASGGGGIALDLVNVTNVEAIVNAIEVTAASPVGSPTATVDLQYSADGGGSWQMIATSLAMDATGRGAYNWAVPAVLPEGNNYLVRAIAHATPAIADASDQPFLIANGGHDYYINDLSTVGDQFTTSPGANASSGKSPAAPMATLQALLDAYDLDPGDVVHVDAGAYTLLRTVTFVNQDNGVKVEGPTANTATLNRANTTDDQYDVVRLSNADDVTLSHLRLTGGYYGIVADSASDSDRLSLLDSEVYGNYYIGIYLETSNDQAVIARSAIYGLPGGTGLDDQSYGLYLLGNDEQILDNAIHESSTYGIYASGVRGHLTGNVVYGNRYGLVVYNNSTAPNQSLVSGNQVHDNTQYGISVQGGGVIVANNTIFNQSANNAVGIYTYATSVHDNVVYSNFVGIQDAGYSTVANNRVFNNASAGIQLDAGGNATTGNKIYSNSVGIRTGYYYQGVIANNVIYANTNQGLLLQSPSTNQRDILNNTIYQLVGDAIRIDMGTVNVRLRNNLVWVESGYDVNVVGATSGFDTDYNLLFQGADPNAHVGFFGGAIRDSLANWFTAVGQDANSLESDPLFVDANGADNILGYTLVGGSYRDGGPDDNFYRVKGSPATDHGDSWYAQPTDLEGFARQDDPGTTPNAGRDDYQAAVQGSSQFAALGSDVATGWRSNDTYFALTLPFSFPFYNASYTSAYVSTEGFIQFGTATLAEDHDNSVASLLQSRRIAPLWDDLRTDLAGDNIYLNTATPNQITIRWNASVAASNGDVQFSITLFSDGKIRYDYGPGTGSLTPTVGVSMGTGRASTLVAGYDAAANLANANSVLFTLQPGYADMGAYEFRGSSFDVTPPTIVASSPSAVHTSGVVTSDLTQLQLTFSEEVNPIDANALANYELRSPGLDTLYGSNDDVVFSITPVYVPGANFVTLNIASSPLPSGSYRLTVKSDVGASLHDLAGIPLDGDANGSPLGDYVRTFNVVTTLHATTVADSGPGSLRQAILDANASPGIADTILFEIPGAGVHAIALNSPLPALIDPVTFEIAGDTVEIGTASAFELDGFPGLTKTGDGTLVLGGVGSVSGQSLTVTEGTVQLAAGSGIVLVVNSLAIGPAAALDLADNDLVVQATLGTRNGVLAAITGYLTTGANGLAWTGPGIRSSAAANDPTFLTALGLMLNDNGLGGAFYPSFSGQAVDANSVLVKYTYYGDADLSGAVDGTDYALIDNGFNAALTGWFNGDFDYSNVVDGTDYALIDNAFNSQGGPLAGGKPDVFGPIPRAANCPGATASFGRSIDSLVPETHDPFDVIALDSDVLDALLATTTRRRRNR